MKSHRNSALALLAAALALLAPAPARAADRSPRGDRPEWVDGEALEWPRSRYLTGVGVADEPTAAEDRARAEIARTFTARVTGTTSTAASEETVTAGGRARQTSSTRVSDEASSSTDKVLEGLEIAARWQDPQTRRHHALAVLDRRRAAAAIAAKLEEVEARARPLAAELRAGGAPLPAALAGLRLARLRADRAPLLADLRVVDPRADTAGATDDVAPLVEKALGRLKVDLRATGDGATVVRGGAARGLAAAGLRGRAAKEGASDADLVVEVESSADEVAPTRDGWFWGRSTAHVTVRAPGSDEILTELDETAREAARRRSDAGPRAARSLADKLARRLPDALRSLGAD